MKVRGWWRGWLGLAVALLLGLGAALPAAAAGEPPPLRLAGGATAFPLEGHLSILVDEGGTLTIGQVAASREFRPLGRQGLTTGTLWYRFTTRRGDGMPAGWILAFGEPDIDDARLYVPAPGGGFTEIALGRRIPSRDLPLAARRHVAALDLPEAEPVTLHLRLSSERKIRFEEAALWRPGALMYEEARQSAFFGLRFGVLAVVVVVSTLFGVWLRDWTMLAYALYVATDLCRGLSHTAIVTLLFPAAGRDTNYLLTGLGLLGGAAAFVFMWDRIFDLRRNFPAVHRLYMLAGAVLAASLPLVMSPWFHEVARTAQSIMLAASLGSIAMAVILLRRHPGDVLLRLYLLAFLPFTLLWGAEIGAILFPQIPVSLGREIHAVASFIHIATLCVAMAYRLSDMQRERMRAEAALAGEQLARQRLRTFVDMATHEFKTPLAVIDSAAQMLDLLTVPGRPEIAGRIATIRRTVRRLVKLVDTCLAGERDELLAVKLQPMAPSGLVEHVADRNRDTGPAPVIARTSGLPGLCLADPDLLGIALDALIDNARRYGPGDQPVEIGATGEGGRIVFRVEDRGPGLPPGDAERVFEKYYRCPATASVPGSGLGLHLVKTIADLHGGEVTYRPRKGGGACFALAIPIVAAPPPAAASRLEDFAGS